MKLVLVAVCSTLLIFLLFAGVEGGVLTDTQSPNETKIIVNWCEICMALFEWLDSHIANATEHDLEFLFSKACSLVPVSQQADCHSLADQLVPIITELLLEEYIPIKLCRLLTLCGGVETDSRGVVDGEGAPRLMTQYKPDTFADNELDLHSTADVVCASLPVKYSDLCREVMKTRAVQQLMSQIKQTK